MFATSSVKRRTALIKTGGCQSTPTQSTGFLINIFNKIFMGTLEVQTSNDRLWFQFHYQGALEKDFLICCLIYSTWLLSLNVFALSKFEGRLSLHHEFSIIVIHAGTSLCLKYRYIFVSWIFSLDFGHIVWHWSSCTWRCFQNLCFFGRPVTELHKRSHLWTSSIHVLVLLHVYSTKVAGKEMEMHRGQMDQSKPL